MWSPKRFPSKGWFNPLWALLLVAVVWCVAQFARDLREAQEHWIRATCCFIVLVLLGVATTRLGTSKGFSRVAVAGMVGISLTLSAVGTVPGIRDRLGSTRIFNTWNFFHYYLGSKYFKELGYNDLYPEMLKADREKGYRFDQVRQYMRQTDYELVAADETRNEPRSPAWTEARWQEFKRDVAVIARHRNREFWRDPFTDRGYNAPPGWSVVGGSLTKWLDPRSSVDLTVMALVEPLLLLIAFVWSVGAYGLLRSMIVLAAAASWIGCTNLFGGKLLQFDWFAAAWAGMASMKRGRWALAGALLAYATSTRFFPAVLMLGPLAQSVYSLLRQRRIPKHLMTLLVSGAISLAVLCAIATVANGRGLAIWREFAIAISEHNSYHKFGGARLGIQYMMTVNGDTGLIAEASHRARTMAYESNTLLRYGIQAGLLGLFLLAVRRENSHDAAILGLVILFGFAVSSRYYGIVYALLLLRHLGDVAADAPLGYARRWLYFAAGFWLLLLVTFLPPLMGGNVRAIYMTANGAILLYLVVTLVLAVRARATVPV